VIQQLTRFRSQRQEAGFIALAAHADLRFRHSRSSRFRSRTSWERSPCNSINPTIAKSREVRKLDQNRATSSTDNGDMVRLGVFTRNLLKASRGLPMPIGARCQYVC
jgi:hypothetical protein